MTNKQGKGHSRWETERKREREREREREGERVIYKVGCRGSSQLGGR